ncbi:MAG: peptidase [Tindallia sp. MSAO_Bac2]|nr:MAG: peptidase [Tindallia sp. MSAO_Bac2]
MNETKKKVSILLDKKINETVRILADFVQYPSLAGYEKEAQEFIAKEMKLASLDVDLWEPTIEDTYINPTFLTTVDIFSGSPNVVGTFKGTGGGKSMILNGHVDVVPVNDSDWDKSPWSGAYEDGRIYGRGASDMKGGLVSHLMAIKAIAESGIKLKGDVYLQSVIGEETGGIGTLSAISRGYCADGAIISEPTDLVICPVSMGAMWFRIFVKGRAAHAGTSEFGVNAISKMCLVIGALNEFNDFRSKNTRHPLYKNILNPFNINVGAVRGGSFPTSVPDEIYIEGRMAISPDEEVEEARTALENAVMEAATNDEWLVTMPPQVEWYGFCLSPGGISLEHPLVNTVKSNCLSLGLSETVISGTPWGTDAGALIKYANTPTIVFGPGPGSTAHQANEYIDVQKVIEASKVIACTLLDWCDYEKL